MPRRLTLAVKPLSVAFTVLCSASITIAADDAVPQSHVGHLCKAAGSSDKTFVRIERATHYYVGQPELLKQAVDVSVQWLQDRGFY